MKEHIVKLQTWWQQLAEREKQAVMIGGIALSIFIFYAGIWRPYFNHLDNMRSNIHASEQTLQWMQSADKTLKKIEGQTAPQNKTLSPVVLLGLLQKQITEAGLASNLSDLKQADSNSISAQFQNVNFDKLIGLLTTMAKSYKVSITQMNAISVSNGIVNAEIIVRQG